MTYPPHPLLIRKEDIVRVTAELLRAKYACGSQVVLFESLFPEGVEITQELCVKHARDFDWSWAAKNLLPEKQREDYAEGRGLLMKDYAAKRAPLLVDYEAKHAPLLAGYMAKCAPLWADYAAKDASLWADYEAKRAPLRADYEAKRAPLLADYDAKCVSLLAGYIANCASLFMSLAGQVP